MGVTVDPKSGYFYWTQKAFPKANLGRIFRAGITMSTGQTAENRSGIETVFEHRPECINLEIVSEKGMLYWTDRGEYPFGCTLNRSYVGPDEEVTIEGAKTMPELDIQAGHFHEPIGLKTNHVNHHVYLTDMGSAIYRFGLDGSGRTKLYDSDHMSFTGITLAHL